MSVDGSRAEQFYNSWLAQLKSFLYHNKIELTHNKSIQWNFQSTLLSTD